MSCEETVHPWLKNCVLKFIHHKKIYMETQRFNLTAPWEEVKEKLKETNINLTDEDLAYEPGQEDDLLERLEKKLSKNKAEIVLLIESVSANKRISG